MANSSIEWNFESRYVVFPDCWFGATTVFFWSVYSRSYNICTYRELFKIEKEGRSSTILRNQCVYALQQNRLLSSVLPDENQSLVLQSIIVDIQELCSKHMLQCVPLGPVPLIIQVCGQHCTMLGS